MRTALKLLGHSTHLSLGPGCTAVALCSGRRFSPVFVLFGVLREQDGAEAMEIARHHGEGHVALEAVEAMIRAAVEPMGFERVDRRLHGRVLAAQAHEARAVLAFLLGLGALAFFRQDREVDDLGEALLELGQEATDRRRLSS